MTGTILVINAGSSSIKFSVFGIEAKQLNLISKGEIEGIGTNPHFIAKDPQGTVLTNVNWEAKTHGDGYADALKTLLDWLRQRQSDTTLMAVGHRVVHGGAEICKPVIIDDTVLATLNTIVSLMPLHLPHNLSAIRAVAQIHPQIPQVACFDTAFHNGHPKVADCFGLPQELYESGVRRYGFHGISYEYINRALKKIAPDLSAGRVVVAHLGNGASMCAIKNCRSIDSTMGFSALDGLPMGTRCGNLDPGVILYLIQEQRMTPERIEELLYKNSGLLGLSGISNDLRDLLSSNNTLAVEAIDYFVYHIGKELGSLTATLHGLDGLVFTAGIGEHSSEIRKRVCEDAAWLGIELDNAANEQNRLCISRRGTSPSVWVIPTDEERMIALHTLNCVAS